MGITLLNRKTVDVVREAYFAERVVFVGGLGGCGKTLLTPVVGSLDRVEIQKFNFPLEHVCTLHSLNKINDDVAVTMIRLLTDLDLYNLMMSRETNFRPRDLSSVFMNPRRWRYLRRLFLPGDDAVPERIHKERPILQLVVHDLLGRGLLLFLALRERARLVEMVRHPLYMLKQWYVNVKQFCSGVPNPRHFGIWYEHQGNNFPWFAIGWEDLYLKSNMMDKAIYIIQHNLQLIEHTLQRLSSLQRKQVLIIPFEQFVTEPWPFINQLEILLETRATSSTYRELRRQHVPREKFSDGIDLPIYKKYGWEPAEPGADERQELKKRRAFAAELASREAMEVLDRLSDEYEKQYLQGKL